MSLSIEQQQSHEKTKMCYICREKLKGEDPEMKIYRKVKD